MMRFSQTKDNERKRSFLLYQIVDNTGSMGQSCTSGREASSEVRATANLSCGPETVRIGVIGDYDNATPGCYNGGWSLCQANISNEDLESWFQTFMKPCGGRGAPEAYKTALNMLLKEEPGLVFLYLDAVPHGFNSITFQNTGELDDEGKKEYAFLQNKNMITDWDTLVRTVKSSGFQFVTLSTHGDTKFIDIWADLGYVVHIKNYDARTITNTTLKVMYAFLNQPQDRSIEYHYKGNDGKRKTTNTIQSEYKIDIDVRLKSAMPTEVLEVFEMLLDAKKPRNVLTLMTSPILGKFWRLICGKYKFMDECKYDVRCQHVQNLLSKSMNSDALTSSEKAQMKEWIDQSHDNTPHIRFMINRVLNSQDQKALVLVLPNELKGTVKLDDVLELGRGGSNFNELGRLIVSLVPSQEEKFYLPDDKSKTPDFLPLFGLKTSEIFQLIGNLLSPGLLFGQVLSLMGAVLALPNKYLGQLAHQYLLEKRGQWINWSIKSDGTQQYPVFWSYNFMRFLNLVPDELLVTNEIEFRDHYIRSGKIIYNRDATISLVVPLIDESLRLNVTWKRLCPGCNQYRCFTIYPGDSEICGHCIYLNDQKHIDDHVERGLDTNPANIKEKVDGKTFWTQCHTCKSNYGVTCTEWLNVRPKCHNCRNNLKPEFVQCCCCLHKYCSPGNSGLRAVQEEIKYYLSRDEKEKAAFLENDLKNNRFRCPRCVENPSSMIKDVEIKIKDLIEENPQLSTLIPNYNALVRTKVKVWQRINNTRDAQDEKMEEDVKIDYLFYRGYMIHNPKDVVKKFVDTLLNNSGFAPCQLCIEDCPVRNIELACGTCQNRICKECSNNWYSQVKIGEIVSHCHTVCPFCKTPPKYSLIGTYDLGKLRNVRPTRLNRRPMCEWDPRTIYASCKECFKVVEALDRNCARVAPNIQNFICNPCREQNRKNEEKVNLENAPEAECKACPGCGQLYQRSSGCNHMTCSQDCHDEAVHWCYVCGQGGEELDGEYVAYDNETIYDHMANCGGIFPDY